MRIPHVESVNANDRCTNAEFLRQRNLQLHEIIRVEVNQYVILAILPNKQKIEKTIKRAI